MASPKMEEGLVSRGPGARGAIVQGGPNAGRVMDGPNKKKRKMTQRKIGSVM